jgi:hypothetical protein
VPTKHQRIAVVNDEELQDALRRAAPHVEPGTKTATLVHDLAIKGAEALAADERAREQAIERLIERSTSDDPGYDREVLADIDRLAWGLEP